MSAAIFYAKTRMGWKEPPLTPEYQFGWFNRDVCNRLDAFLAAVVRRQGPRLMLFAPPRHGKSELVSRKFPAYAFGRYPDLSILATSYGADLSSRVNREVQRLIDEPRYSELFPETMLSGSGRPTSGVWARNNDIFEVVGRRGSYRSAGVGGGITGMGGDILIVDDPVKDAAQANSEVYRQSVWDWATPRIVSQRLSASNSIGRRGWTKSIPYFRMTPEMSSSCKRCMMTTIADLSGSLTLNMARSRNLRVVFPRSVSLSTVSVE